MILNDIFDDIDFLCGSTSATYLPTHKVRNINVANRDVARIIWESADDWNYVDSNLSTLPVAYATLVIGQNDYTLPTTAQRVRRVEVKDGSGNYVKLRPMDDKDVTISMEEFHETDSTPLYYDLVGRSVILYPAPGTGYVTVASGLAVHVDKDVEAFTTASTGSTPGFAEPFHRILSYAASIDYTQDENQREFFIRQKDRLEKGLTKFYQKRNVERPVSIRPASQKRWRQYK